MKVLIVDDSAVQRKLMARYLGDSRELQVMEAADGAEALNRLEQQGPPDLVLTDWNMPVMDGLALVRRLRADERYKAARILVVTTENEPWAVVRAIRAGADEYLMKPFDQLGLRSKLATLFGPEDPIFGQVLV